MYLESDTLLLADVFEIYQLDPAKFVSALGLAWQTALKKTEVKLKLLTGIIKWCKRHEMRNMSHNSSIC